MKIVVVTGLAYSFVNFRYELLKRMRDFGHEVTCIAPSDISGLTDKSEIEFVRSKLKELEIDLKIVDFKRTNFNVFQDLYFLIKLYLLLNQIKADMVIAYTMKSIVLGIVSAWLNNIPARIAWITGTGSLFSATSGVGRFTKLFGKIGLKFALKRATLILCQNKENADTIQSLDLSLKEKIKISIDGVNTEKFNFIPKEVQNLPVKILFVGRLLLEKGIFELAEASKIVHASHPDVKFIVVGTSDLNTSSLKEEDLKKLKEDGHLEFLGKSSDVVPFYEDCDIFCLPSYHEGLPRTILEAMSVGRPVVTTDVAGCKDVTQHGVTGLIVPAKNSQALAAAINVLIECPDKRSKMGKAARELVEEKFSVTKNLNEMSKICGFAQ